MSRLLQELVRAPLVEVERAWLKPPAVGDRIGRFELVRQIGAGGFGIVFEARDVELGRSVAFKALRPWRAIAPGQADGLRAEAEAAARLNHPSIVTVHDFGTCDSGPYVIMELLRGEPLQARLDRGNLSLAGTVKVALEVARALAHAHAEGVVHRDLNPGNVFLCDSGAVKVLDFGLARVLGSGGPRGGTPSYSAPEQWRGEANDGRVDLFGLGCLLHRMLVGRTPYETTSGRLTVLEPGPAPQPDLDGVPPRLARLMRRLVQRAPEDRPAAAAEVVIELERVTHELDPARRRLRLAVALALALLASAGAVALSARWWTRPPPPGRPVVAVADVENRTDEPGLDGLAGLLGTALEQSRHVTVLPRGRMWAELTRMGRGDAQRIDEPLARELGRRLDVTVLLAAIHRFGDTYAMELRALDSREDRYLFTLSERVDGRARIPDLIDSLALRARRELAEPDGAVQASQQPLGVSVTHSVQAYQHYFAGLDCQIRRDDSERSCPDHFLKALEADPSFTLAHHQLAYLMGAEGTDEAGARRENALAVAGAERAPPRERALILAYQAELDGRVEEAVSAYQEAAARFPEDHEVHARAGYYLHRLRDWSRAVTFMRRAVALDPERGDASRLLVAELVQLGRLDELRSYAETWSTLAATPARRALLVRAWFWLGERERALEVARQAAASGGLAAHYQEAVILFSRGEFGAARAALGKDVEAGQADAYVRAGIGRTLTAQGRFRAALERMAPDDGSPRHGLMRHARATARTAERRPGPVWEEARSCASADPLIAAGLASDLALLGDLPHARELARRLEPGSLDARVWRAVLAWREGRAAEALAALKTLSAEEPVPSWWGMPPAYALAVVAGREGHDQVVLAAVERLLSVWHPLSARGGAMVPEALLLRASAEARLGRRDQARATLQRLLEERAGGDAGDPVAADARGLLATLR
jgi:tetratricopeptide (TPR) repeat protein